MEDDENRTIYCTNLSPKITEEILYELFLQGGPVERVRIPNDREGRPQSYGFVTYKHQCSVLYAINLFENISLFDYKLVMKPKNYNAYYQENIPLNNMFVSMCEEATSRKINYCKIIQDKWNSHANNNDRDRNNRGRNYSNNHRHDYKRSRY